MITKLIDGTPETCDDGVPGDPLKCDITCTIVDSSCEIKRWATKCPSNCGNWIKEIASSEDCDDGNTNSGDGCSDLCKYEDTTQYDCFNAFSNDVACSDGFPSVMVLKSTCGNGRIEGQEFCDAIDLV